MGFYGNITNTSNTSFSFTKIYPNRLAMETELAKNKDGVHLGGYVLVEYGDKKSNKVNLNIINALREEDNGELKFLDINNKEEFILVQNLNEIENNKICVGALLKVDKKIVEGSENEEKFYVCIGSKEGSNIATFNEIDINDEYNVNYSIDYAAYKKGYDSTVWIKANTPQEDGFYQMRFVQIAELNSVVPTFNLSVDAPTTIPQVPYFDIDSTDTWYDLHVQPSWGFQIAKTNNPEETDVNAYQKKRTTDKNEIYCNFNSEHQNYTLYDYEKGINSESFSMSLDSGWYEFETRGKKEYIIINIKNEKKLLPFEQVSTKLEYPAHIYYNKAGFDLSKSSRSTLKDDIYITFDGKSGQKYYQGNSLEEEKIEAPDIQQFHMLLPSIGNTISDIWDIIYSKDRKTFITKGTTPDKSDDEDNKTYELNTIAGCINSANKLMGQIMQDVNPEFFGTTFGEDEYNKNYIYRYNKLDSQGGATYYYLTKKEKYDLMPSGYQPLPTDKEEYCVAKIINKEASEGFKVGAKWNNKYSVPKGILLGKLVKDANGKQVYQYVPVEIDIQGKLDTLYGFMLKLKRLIALENPETRDTSTFQGVINHLNDIILNFENLSPNQLMAIDGYGRADGIEIDTDQTFSYYNLLTGEKQNEETGKEETWIKTDLVLENINALKSPLKEIGKGSEIIQTSFISKNIVVSSKNIQALVCCYYKELDSKYRLIEKNGVEKIGVYIKDPSEEGYNLVFSLPYEKDYSDASSNKFPYYENNLPLHYPVDNMSPEEVYYFGAYELQGKKKVFPEKIKPNSKNVLKINHQYNPQSNGERHIDLNQDKGELKLYYPTIDNTGHVVSHNVQYTTLPYGYKTININGNTDSTNKIESNSANIIANDITDSLSVNSGNKWISIEGKEKQINIGHRLKDSNIEGKYINLMKEDGKLTTPQFFIDKAGHIEEIAQYPISNKQAFGYTNYGKQNLEGEYEFQSSSGGKAEWIDVDVGLQPQNYYSEQAEMFYVKPSEFFNIVKNGAQYGKNGPVLTFISNKYINSIPEDCIIVENTDVEGVKESYICLYNNNGERVGLMNLRTNGGLETVITINPEDPKDPNQKNIPFSEGEIDKEIPIFLGKKQENNTFPDSINVIQYKGIIMGHGYNEITKPVTNTSSNKNIPSDYKWVGEVESISELSISDEHNRIAKVNGNLDFSQQVIRFSGTFEEFFKGSVDYGYYLNLEEDEIKSFINPITISNDFLGELNTYYTYIYNLDGSYVGKIYLSDVGGFETNPSLEALNKFSQGIVELVSFFICKDKVNEQDIYKNVIPGYYRNFATAEKWEYVEIQDIYEGDGNNRSTSDLVLYTPIVDTKGHIIGHNIENVILPYAFNSVHIEDKSKNGNIKIINSEDKTIQTNSHEGQLKINIANEWINLNGNNNQLTLGHKFSGYSSGKEKYESNKGKITLPKYNIDEAGHICGVSNTNIAFNIGDCYYYDPVALQECMITSEEFTHPTEIFYSYTAPDGNEYYKIQDDYATYLNYVYYQDLNTKQYKFLGDFSFDGILKEDLIKAYDPSTNKYKIWFSDINNLHQRINANMNLVQITQFLQNKYFDLEKKYSNLLERIKKLENNT